MEKESHSQLSRRDEGPARGAAAGRRRGRLRQPRPPSANRRRAPRESLFVHPRRICYMYNAPSAPRSGLMEFFSSSMDTLCV